MTMFWGLAEGIINSETYRNLAEEITPNLKRLDLVRNNIDISQDDIKLTSILTLDGEDGPYTQLTFGVPQIEWSDGAQTRLDEIVSRYDLNLEQDTTVKMGSFDYRTCYRVKAEGRRNTVATVYENEVEIDKDYEKSKELFEALVRDFYVSDSSKGLVKHVLEGEVIESNGELYKSYEEWEADEELLRPKMESVLNVVQTKGASNLDSNDYQNYVSLVKKLLEMGEKAKRSGIYTEKDRLDEEGLKEQTKIIFFGYTNSLLEKLEGADVQEGSAILHEIKIAAEKAREYGVDDGEIRAIEQAAEMGAGIGTAFSFLESMAGAMGKEKGKNSATNPFSVLEKITQGKSKKKKGLRFWKH